MLGGIYTGVFSPVEGGAIGACTVFILNLLRRKFSLTMFITSLKNVVGTTAMIFLVVIGAMMFSKFLMISNLTGTLKTFIEGLHVSPMIVLFIILFIYIILGCILPVVAMLAISLPIFFPILSGLGFDGIWFGIMIILEVEIAALTPPVGLNVYVLKAVVGDLLSTGGIFRSILPFFILDLIILAILIAFPMISLWLPSMMYK